MKILNLTPHEVCFVGAADDGGDIVIPPSGVVARVGQKSRPFGRVYLSNGDIPVVLSEYGQVTGLPDNDGETSFVVSAMVRLAVPNRWDVYSPADFVRDANGEIVGCKALEGNQ